MGQRTDCARGADWLEPNGDPVRPQGLPQGSEVSRRKLVLRLALAFVVIVAAVLLLDARNDCAKRDGTEFILMPPVGCEQIDE